MKGTNVTIGHLDADCFYASAERVRFPELRDIAVAVLGNQGACVIAKSYEMKAWGVKTGMPIWEALPLCPAGAYLKRDFRWYEVVSRRMLEVVREMSDQVEFYSIDEFFFRTRPDPQEPLRSYAESLQRRILDEVGVPVSIGIARSRTLAKLVSDTVKPFGVGVLADQDAERAFLKDIPVTEISGIAGKRAKRLLPWGVVTCLELAQADRRLIRNLLTASGEVLWWELRGEAVQPIQITRPRHKALSRGGSFGEATDDPMVIYAWFVRNLERLIEELEFHRLLTKKLSVYLAYRGGQWGSGMTKLTVASDRFAVLLDAGRYCLRQAYMRHQWANRMHIIAEELCAHSPRQMGFFERDDPRAEALATLKRSVNQRFGRFALRSGATLPLYAIYQDKSNKYDICDIRGKFCF